MHSHLFLCTREVLGGGRGEEGVAGVTSRHSQFRKIRRIRKCQYYSPLRPTWDAKWSGNVFYKLVFYIFHHGYPLALDVGCISHQAHGARVAGKERGREIGSEEWRKRKEGGGEGKDRE